MAEEEEKPKPEKEARLLAKLLKPPRSSPVKPYLYPGLPERCFCHTPDCGYVLESPGKHCAELTCPRCGARLWRAPP